MKKLFLFALFSCSISFSARRPIHSQLEKNILQAVQALESGDYEQAEFYFNPYSSTTFQETILKLYRTSQERNNIISKIQSAKDEAIRQQDEAIRQQDEAIRQQEEAVRKKVEAAWNEFDAMIHEFLPSQNGQPK